MSYTMKSSGVDWIGDIPAHWEVKRVKDILHKLIAGKSIDLESLKDTGYPVYGSNGIRGYAEKYMYDGDFWLIGRQGSAGSVNLASGKFWPAEHALVAIKKSIVNHTWLGFLLQDMNLPQYAGGSAQPGLAASFIQKLNIAYPSQEEQHAIAAYLDDRTSVIDSKISALEEKEQSLAELRKSLIQEAVTKGLSKSQLFLMLERFSNLSADLVEAFKKNYQDFPLKNSGLSLIGEVPSHWEIKRLKDIVATPITDGPHETPVLLESGYPFISVESIVNGKIDLYKKRGFISKEDYLRYSVKYKPQRDDILFVKSASVGKVSIVDTDEPFQVWSPLAAIRCNKKNVPKFIYFVMASSYFQESVLSGSSLNTQYNIGMKKLGNVPIALPTLYEQHAIAHYLDESTSVIDQSIDTVKKEIEALQELRKSLIHEAVTGKLDVADFGYNY